MYLVDFIYDGVQLSKYGCIVGSIVTNNNDSINMGSVVTLDTIQNNGSYNSEIINTRYEDVYTCTFDILKNSCMGYGDSFSDNEITWFMRWLNRKDYHKFIPIYDDPSQFYKLYMMGTFTEVKAISMGGEIVGFTLTFTSDSPFSYLDYMPVTFNHVTNFSIVNASEELGAIYPDKIKITCHDDGDLVIINQMDNDTLTYPYTDFGKVCNKCNTAYTGISTICSNTDSYGVVCDGTLIGNWKNINRYTEIYNCTNGEIITLDCKHKIIKSSATHSTLHKDFNYVFPRMVNTIKENDNKFSLSFECTVEIEYKPIRKVGAIV